MVKILKALQWLMEVLFWLINFVFYLKKKKIMHSVNLRGNLERDRFRRQVCVSVTA